ncbi:MAG: hypothetical protein U0165_07645 [Polyangiaceae bacterium]
MSDSSILRRSWAQRLVLLATVLALGATVSACGKPTLRLNHAEVAGVGIGGVAMNVVVDVHNPYSFDVNVQNVRAVVNVGMVSGLQVSFNPNLWLKADGDTQMAVPVTLPWPAVLALLANTVGADTIPYHVDAKADVVASRTFEIKSKDEALQKDGQISRAQVLAAARTTMPNAY